MLYVYPANENPITMSDWDGNGTISFSPNGIPLTFLNGEVTYPLPGLDWAEAYCLVHLGIDLARYDAKNDLFVWKRMPSEPLPRNLIQVSGNTARNWQKLLWIANLGIRK